MDGVAAFVAPLHEQLTEERLHHLEPKVREQVLHAAGLPKEKRLKEQQELVKKYVNPLQISEDEIARRFPEYAALRDRTRKAIALRPRVISATQRDARGQGSGRP
jgi:hypothetical protein